MKKFLAVYRGEPGKIMMSGTIYLKKIDRSGFNRAWKLGENGCT